MMFVFKKKWLIFIAVAVVLTIMALGATKELVAPDETAFLPSEARTVIIDAGHGAPT